MKLILLFIFSISSFASISEAQFLSVPKEIVSLFQNEIIESGLTLSINPNWESNTVNAGANRSRKDNTAVLNLHGGFARINSMTVDTFAMTICHEVGHLIGGLPKVMPTKKYSSEGQSDYFATKVCLKKYLKNKIVEVKIPKFHSNLCLGHFSKKEELNLCYKMMRVSIDQLTVDNFLAPREAYSDIEKLDLSKTFVTNFNDYPKVSCRYTTHIYGALNKERPSCWFNNSIELTDSSYLPNYIYPESMFVGTAYNIQTGPMGCSFNIRSIDYFRDGQFESVYEDDLLDSKVYSFKECSFSENGPASGTVTEYLGELYLNLNRTDK